MHAASSGSDPAAQKISYARSASCVENVNMMAESITCVYLSVRGVEIGRRAEKARTLISARDDDG